MNSASRVVTAMRFRSLYNCFCTDSSQTCPLSRDERKRLGHRQGDAIDARDRPEVRLGIIRPRIKQIDVRSLRRIRRHECRVPIRLCFQDRERAARLPSAPGLFSTTAVAFVAVRMLSARCLVTLSVALPGGNGTTSVMRWEEKGSADTFEEAAAKSSRIAGPRTALNLMSPSSRCPCRYRTLMYYLWVLAQGDR